MTKQDDVNESCKLSWEERKWLMSDNADNKQFYAECQILYKSTKNLVKNLKNVLIQAKEYSQVDEVSLKKIWKGCHLKKPQTFLGLLMKTYSKKKAHPRS